jgi:predicted transglutaminase-like cysteine proteinase
MGNGLFTTLTTLINRNRLGEMLVVKGVLTPAQLRQGLALQKDGGEVLGRVLVRHKLVKRRDLYSALVQQSMLRCMIGAATFCLLLAGAGVKNARAGSIRDIPQQIQITSVTPAAFAQPFSRAPLFGTTEKASTNIDPFTKWSGMFRRLDAAIADPGNQRVVTEWKQNLESMRGLPLEEMAERVNDLANKQAYINDSRNWGTSDYWETPVEFFNRGGDCEDFAIAKYISLRALGVPESRLRITILQDMQKNIPHAVLAVYTDDDVLILDNQIKSVRSSSSIGHYKPIFSINRTAWWLHTKGDPRTIVASAE